MTEAVVDMLAEEWDHITELCSSLSPEQWTLPTDCPGWTVQDQLAHVAGTESMLAGRANPPAPSPFPGHVKNSIGEFNEAWVEHYRSQPPAEVLAVWKALAAERVAQLRAAPTERFDELGPSPVGKVPYRQFMYVRAMDCWVHEQDIRRAVGQPGHRSGPIAANALGRFVDAMPFVVGKKAGAADGASVIFDLDGESAQRIAVRVDGGRAGLVDPAEVAEATATIAMDAETWWVLALGRRSAAEVRAAGDVTVQGDEALGRAVVDNLAFMA